MAELLKIENDNLNNILGKRERFAPGEQIIKFKQTMANEQQLKSEFWFPKNPKYYPKNLRTKISESQQAKPLVCSVTGAPAKYKDPLTGQPFANKEAFKIIREKYFQKEEEKLFIHMQVLGDLLQQKKDRLRRYVQQERNLDLPIELQKQLLKSAQPAKAATVV